VTSRQRTPEAVKKDWVAGLLPGVQVVPSGVLGVAHAQELGCVYCFAGVKKGIGGSGK